MMKIKVFVLIVIIAYASCGDDAMSKWMKMGECWKQTSALSKCCPLPQHKNMLSNEKCKQHFDEKDEKDFKEQFKAKACGVDCIFKAEGLMNDNNVFDEAKIKEKFGAILTANDGGDFKDITMESIDFCLKRFGEKKEEWEKMAAEWKKKKGESADDSKCSMWPLSFVSCVRGSVVRKCPDSKWQKNDECDGMKSKATPISECYQ